MATEPTKITESVVEKAALDWLCEAGYEVLFGLAIAPMTKKIIPKLPEPRMDGMDDMDSLPVQRKRGAVEKGVKMTLAAMLPAAVRYRVLHHASKSNLDLQIADYCTWAIYWKWNGSDERPFNRVKAAVRSEWDVLQAETGFPD